MRQALVHCCIMVVALGLFGGVTQAELVGHWELDEISGTVAVDGSGNGNDATLIDDPTRIEGKIGGALSLDGTDDDVEIPALNITTNTITITAWVKIEQDPADWTGIVYARQPGVNNNGRGLDFSTGGQVGYTWADTADEWGWASGLVVSQNEWAFVACVIEPDKATLYLNEETAVNTVAHPEQTVDFPWHVGHDVQNAAARRSPMMIDDIRIYTRAVSADEMPAIMAGNAELASAPKPDDQGVDVPRDVILNWAPGEFAATHDVYFDTVFEDVNSATVPTSAGQDVNSFDPGRLDFDKTYFWRVDEVNGTPDKTVFKGTVWSFEVEPYSIQIAGSDIIATASSYSNEFSMPGKTLDGSGLSEDGTHSIETEAMWFTAMSDADPWIQYEFDAVKKLDMMTVWNSNSSAEGFIGYGIKGVEIQYSVDGQTWDNLKDANEFSRASGLPSYDQYDEIAFNGVAAKMVRLNIQSNFGGFLKSYSLSEVQFKAIPTAARTPDPVSGSTGILPNDVLSWRAGRETAQSTVYLSTDPNEVADAVAPSATSDTDSINLSTFDLQMGETYYWRVDEVNDAEAVSVWTGPVWSLTVVDAVVVDDFESYNNESPNRPFQAWLDGFGYSADEFFPVEYPGNGTGAGIGHDIWTGGSLHYNGQIMEETVVKRGNLSLPLYYMNTGGVASLTERTFAVPQDWTAGGAKTLSILFRGQADNTGTLFVRINDVKLTYPRDAANIAKPVWQVFNIDLDGVNTNLAAVTKLSIGVEGAGASGMLLIDDIALYPEVGQVISPVDPGTANLVGFWNFDAGSGTVVADSSGNGNAGTIEGGGQASAWVSGRKDTAISMSLSAYVNVPAAAWSSINTQFTVSFWAKGDATLGNNWTFFAGNTVGRIVSGHLPWGGQIIFDTTEAWDTERVIVDAAEDELRGQWRHWTFVRNAETGEKQVYLDGTLYGSTIASADPIVGIDRFFIGSGDAGGDPYVGFIDEFQLYDKALSAGEILWLAGSTVPIDKPF